MCCKVLAESNSLPQRRRSAGAEGDPKQRLVQQVPSEPMVFSGKRILQTYHGYGGQ
jgi:hypothetical protein